MPFPHVDGRNYFYPAPVMLDSTEISDENDRRLPAGTPKQAINPPQSLLGYPFRSCEQSLPSQQTSGLRYCENSPHKPIFENGVRLNEYNTKAVNSTSVHINYCSPLLKRLLSEPHFLEKRHSTVGLSDHAGQSREHSSGMFMTGGDFNQYNPQRIDDELVALANAAAKKSIRDNEDSMSPSLEYDPYVTAQNLVGNLTQTPLQPSKMGAQPNQCKSFQIHDTQGIEGNSAKTSPMRITDAKSNRPALAEAASNPLAEHYSGGAPSKINKNFPENIFLPPNFEQLHPYGGGDSYPLYDQPAVSISSDNPPDMKTKKDLIKEFSEHQYNSLGFYLKFMANAGQYEAIAYADAKSKKEVLVNIDSCKNNPFSLLGRNMVDILFLDAESNQLHYIRWNQDKTHVYVTLKELENILQSVSGRNSYSLDINSDHELWKNFSYYQHLSLWSLLKSVADSGDCLGISYTDALEKNEVGVNLYAFYRGWLTHCRFDIHSANLLRDEANDAQFTPVTGSNCGHYIFVNLRRIESEVPELLR